ncbi:MAG: hydrolase [Caulobacterales bacterium RIFOXYB1_FULL_67_16]|nr:MAG: hydrolase [Caulobacterales bacterium RIFOXYB1_FULL_67_16]
MIKLPKILLAAVGAASIGGAAQAEANPTIPSDQSVRNIVLVHGAFADGSGWRAVYEDLTARGYRVTIVQNPLTSLADDVAATRRALARQDGGTILVGHSWGGVVITEAGVDDKVKGLVYVSALTADVGETAGDQYEGFGIPSTFVVEEQADGFGFISADRFKEGFAADVGDADVAFMRDSQVPIAMSSFATPVTQAAWRTRPSWFIVATEDAAIAPAMLRQQAEKIGAVKVEIRASHVPMISQPHAVADVIDQAARSAGPQAN